MKKTMVAALSSLMYCSLCANAQNAAPQVPMKRVSIFSSGVGYFFHSGTLTGETEIPLTFDKDSINDALKSLTINDSATSAPIVRYASEQTLERTLKSLKIDISENPSLAEILSSLKGEEVVISVPTAVSGKILAVSERKTLLAGGDAAVTFTLSLVTEQGVRIFLLDEITSIKFLNSGLESDLNKALDVLAKTRNSNVKTLSLSLTGTASRSVSISYVIPSPVWKASYRLDLSQNKPLLQGWAIVDNASETDWVDVELSLVTGKPVSFTQLLYPPYYTSRPILPLSIEGIAQARTHDYDLADESPAMANMMAEERAEYTPSMQRSASLVLPAPGGMSAMTGSQAADQFEFTVKTPVTIMRHSAAMLPLVEGRISAEKIYVVSGSRASLGAIHPEIAVELANETGMKLPAGPVTVFDGGAYAGDALMAFFPQNEKQIISFGEDLSVIASCETKSAHLISGVTVSKGVMTVTRTVSYERLYTVKNSSLEAKTIVIEHPITRDAKLIKPSEADGKTDSLYRFRQKAAPGQTLIFSVLEERPLLEAVELAKIRADSLAVHAANAELPKNVRSALENAVKIQGKIADAQTALSRLESEKTALFAEQERVRQNLQAAGNQSTQGQNYLLRLTALDDQIAAILARIESAKTTLYDLQKELSDYIASMNL
jgi:hypothetical protein